jgi:hypothetical protein
MSEVCLVHLVWKPFGPQPFRDFVASYERHAAGVGHRLVVAFNGFDGESDLREYREVAAGVGHDSFLVSPPTQDIPVYFRAAREYDHRYFCFLNSYSVILDDGWLAKLYGHARREGVGVVGATGSWQSPYSYVLFQQGRPSVYTQLLQDYYRPRRPAWRKPFELSDDLLARIRRQPSHRRLASWLYYRGLVAPFHYVVNGVRYWVEDWARFRAQEEALRREYSADFDAFPAPHVRTNAFMIRRDVMLGLRRAPLLDKQDAYRFESGKEGMTSQLLRAGLRALVVGRDGRGYEPDEWHLSETLWQGEQRNLLVSDNQTKDYARGDSRRRIFLSRAAWGDKARPSLPTPASRAACDAVGNRADVLS